ncbi:hypothetical protein SCUCBS95973_007379 [Sporothrix curviconia]|uniref:HNH domain-containing protein n=1 Tax=Sporothrix curviconia TaxID=1260050 RepID=A0ABP0CDI3_9PEZI
MDGDPEPDSGAVVDVDMADTNYALYREALAAVLIDKLAEPETTPKKRQRRRRGRKAGAKADGTAAVQPGLDDWQVIDAEPQDAEEKNDDDDDDDNNNNSNNINNEKDLPGEQTVADDLTEFVDYLARETFDLLPEDLRTLAHHVWVANAALRRKYGVAEDGATSGGVPAPGPLHAARVAELLPGLEPSPAADSMQAYGVVDGRRTTTAAEVVAPVLSSYLVAATAAPPPPRSTRDQVDGCEICGRDWLRLSYHHLIPRFVHAKVVKRGWHRADELQNVAWLCGACHWRVHRFASHEDLARHYYTVDRLLAAPEMQRYVAWASRLR